MLHDGYHFVTRLTNKQTGVMYYGCKFFRQGCVARLIASGESVRTVNTHTCEVPLPAKVVDVRCEVREKLQRAALKSPSLSPGLVWEHAYAEVRDDYESDTLNPIPKRQGSNIVKNTRAATGT
ncbi:hypothetical protein PC129_g11901 [Phytophthora cactorum]|uniref:FLYWCH-type domain-containing protein n=1 Tax=Phytophthora cactorum TaxID=29920 RepID=A0A329SHL5_9STRA|nr:hypothetical protein Pcac1_g12290 [Phytophthora cactorum]KAG2816317.1 hypothetical protein PC112_g13509 [Phytophthora cactorum]KAG2817982.1 hypothetical protein PC111_g12486 [Phytophthora cactorum]KAG2853458.1 hypothetical protein PC113_g14152 [Phytophthora cactorum]KAG2897351.1 hypothetical protein PC114_g14706 [Phytophthora cactorum]